MNGDHRDSVVRGHKHAGIDLEGAAAEAVLAACAGTVVDIHLSFPHRTVVVEHRGPDGSTFYSSYKHVEDIEITVGDVVGVDTRIGRLFTAEENRRAGFPLVHLHFEIRHSITDRGTASWTSMSREGLDQFCIDPIVFLKPRMK